MYEIDPLTDARWASLVETHPCASVFHTPNWICALSQAYGYEPVAITTCPPGVPLTNGLIFCRIRSWLTSRRLVSLPFSDHCEPLLAAPHDLDDLLAYLRHAVVDGGWASASIRPVCARPAGDSKFQCSATYYWHNLDLSDTAEALLHRFHKDCVQRKIRRAERESLIYDEGTSDLILQKFYDLVLMTRRRQALPPQPLVWFRRLIDAFGPKLKIRLASKQAVPVAGILTLAHKTSMVYKYGCSDPRFKNLGGTAFLFWKTIQEAQANGFEQLDLGRSDTDNAGLIAFKDRWAAQRAVLSYWAYPNAVPARQSACRRALRAHAVSLAPDFALQAMGRLLYRHFG